MTEATTTLTRAERDVKKEAPEIEFLQPQSRSGWRVLAAVVIAFLAALVVVFGIR